MTISQSARGHGGLDEDARDWLLDTELEYLEQLNAYRRSEPIHRLLTLRDAGDVEFGAKSVHAAQRYSWMSPPRRSRRFTPAEVARMTRSSDALGIGGAR